MRGYSEPRGYLALVAVLCFTIILILASTHMGTGSLHDARIFLQRFANEAGLLGSVIVVVIIGWFAFRTVKGGSGPVAGVPECGFFNAQPPRPSLSGADSESETNRATHVRVA